MKMQIDNKFEDKKDLLIKEKELGNELQKFKVLKKIKMIIIIHLEMNKLKKLIKVKVLFMMIKKLKLQMI